MAFRTTLPDSILKLGVLAVGPGKLGVLAAGPWRLAPSDMRGVVATTPSEALNPWLRAVAGLGALGHWRLPPFGEAAPALNPIGGTVTELPLLYLCIGGTVTELPLVDRGENGCLDPTGTVTELPPGNRGDAGCLGGVAKRPALPLGALQSNGTVQSIGTVTELPAVDRGVNGCLDGEANRPTPPSKRPASPLGALLPTGTVTELPTVDRGEKGCRDGETNRPTPLSHTAKDCLDGEANRPPASGTVNVDREETGGFGVTAMGPSLTAGAATAAAYA